MSWTDERVKVLTALWTQGLSASQCAERLGGVTRNSIIGKVHRLGLPARSKSRLSNPACPRGTIKRVRALPLKPRMPAAAPPHVCKPSPVRATEPAKAPQPALMLSVAQLGHWDCRYPFGTPKALDFGYCGHKATRRFGYCEHHHRVVHRKG